MIAVANISCSLETLKMLVEATNINRFANASFDPAKVRACLLDG
jgi:hypothetical protein